MPGPRAEDASDPRTPRLTELALNLWWTWQPEAIELFRDLDRGRWREANHNPLAVLVRLNDEELRQRVIEHSLEARLNFQYRRLQEYLTAATWCHEQASTLLTEPIAYFSAEFALHESLPLYSGGLGVLAGDVLKSASDLGLPLVGVGLYYANGYFRQGLDESGWQRETYGAELHQSLPIVRAAAADGTALTIQVRCGSETLHASVWIAHVGRVRLLLLDTNVGANEARLRGISAKLYGGDETIRIRQEILLGIGGMRALRALDIRPRVLHLNEGHSAFAMLERIRERVDEDGMSLDTALRETAMQTVFTTHTPVDAGHDRFAPELMEQELGWLRTQLNTDTAGFLALGRVRADDPGERYCLTVLALRARHRNAVSAIHGHTTRRMWQTLWPGRPEDEVPIGHVTNGVHTLSWLAPSMKRILDKCLGPDWPQHQADASTWQSIAGLDDAELWEAHAVLRRDLIDFVRRRTGAQAALDPAALTVVFARRFATYKRATLVLSDLDRLAKLCGNVEQPVQFVFAGKAHPRDDEGKKLIQQIVQVARDPRFAGRVVFVPDYDLNVARHLVRGVDLWLNTPARPLEACGTSGQKVLLNGGLNCSVLDGWWAEAYDGDNGFAIGSHQVHADGSVQWKRDAGSLYEVLERQVVPLFYDIDPLRGVPRRWVRRVKRALMTLAWRFSADRMVGDYARTSYLPAANATSCRMPAC